MARCTIFYAVIHQRIIPLLIHARLFWNYVIGSFFGAYIERKQGWKIIDESSFDQWCVIPLFRATGTYEDIKTGPQHVLRIEGGNRNSADPIHQKSPFG